MDNSEEDMIQPHTRLKVADNTGAKVVECIKVIGGAGKYGRLGDLIVVSVKEALPRGVVKKKDVLRAVIVRQKSPYKRADGTYLKFDENAVVLLNKDGTIKGTRIFGPVPAELKERGFGKIISLAKEVV